MVLWKSILAALLLVFVHAEYRYRSPHPSRAPIWNVPPGPLPGPVDALLQLANQVPQPRPGNQVPQRPMNQLPGPPNNILPPLHIQIPQGPHPPGPLAPIPRYRREMKKHV
ncbi:unnamed protein product [Cylicocyclus nassatus]|uniref:Uncharacterized protein n=1 Tax=Cylicocyclus nassatus TaxID=53992 RepID=A0AA36GW99_CYLNA|nr:unnamed protein product [Cylicocyclus nassatus]